MPWAAIPITRSTSPPQARYPQYITTTGEEYVEKNPYAQPLWPLPWFPMGEICEGRAPLTLRGAIGGTTLSLHVLDSNENASLDVYADGVLLKQIALSAETAEDWNVDSGDRLFRVSIPTEVSEIAVRVREPHAYIDTILVEGGFGTVNIVPHDAGDYMDLSEPLPLIIHPDGSYATPRTASSTGRRSTLRISGRITRSRTSTVWAL